MSYKSKEKPEMEGPKDMGATSTIQIDSEVKVNPESPQHHFYIIISAEESQR